MRGSAISLVHVVGLLGTTVRWLLMRSAVRGLLRGTVRLRSLGSTVTSWSLRGTICLGLLRSAILLRLLWGTVSLGLLRSTISLGLLRSTIDRWLLRSAVSNDLLRSSITNDLLWLSVSDWLSISNWLLNGTKSTELLGTSGGAEGTTTTGKETDGTRLGLILQDTVDVAQAHALEEAVIVDVGSLASLSSGVILYGRRSVVVRFWGVLLCIICTRSLVEGVINSADDSSVVGSLISSSSGISCNGITAGGSGITSSGTFR